LIFGCSGDSDVVVPMTTTRYSIDALKYLPSSIGTLGMIVARLVQLLSLTNY